MRLRRRYGTADIGRVLGVTLLVLASGCAVLDVDLTTTPDIARPGDPVTFDVTLTNRSSCPLETSVAIIIPFIQAENFLTEFFGASRSRVPEIEGLFELLESFFDELCSGGDPAPPTVPAVTSSCDMTSDAVVCQLSMPLPQHAGGTGSASFAGLGDSLQCELSDGTLRCQLRIPLAAPGAPADAVNNAIVPALTCVRIEEVDDPLLEAEFAGTDALCFLGSLPDVDGLGPNAMANGQIVLPARGAGRVRNLVIAIGDNEDDMGVCKDGSADEGQPCDLESMTDCPGSSCGEGICEGGGNDGLGCDTSTAMMDCPGGSCVECDDLAEDSFLPIDCTEMIISAQPAPVMSTWMLAGLAVVLALFGTLWLRRRAVR
jgi:hypothetical protein